MRRFPAGAIRDTDKDKIDPEGFESPIVMRRFCEFMDKHRILSDGTIRGSDNWQKGMPIAQYIKSLDRHVLEAKLWARGYGVSPRSKSDPQDIEEVLCAIRFNVSGMLFEILSQRYGRPSRPEGVRDSDDTGSS